jgi:hypothetical protein
VVETSTIQIIEQKNRPMSEEDITGSVKITLPRCKVGMSNWSWRQMQNFSNCHIFILNGYDLVTDNRSVKLKLHESSGSVNSTGDINND